MQSVANIIVNRARARSSLFGNGIIGVCKKKGQFSCWNPETGYTTDANIRRNYNAMKAVTLSDSNFQTAVEIAKKAVNGSLPDLTRGATYYLTKAAYQQHQNRGAKTSSSWSYGEQPLVAVNSHYFFTARQVNGRDV